VAIINFREWQLSEVTELLHQRAVIDRLYLRNTEIEMKSTKVAVKKKKGPGRPATGQDPVITIRLSKDLQSDIEQWAHKRKLSRSTAIRELIQAGLK
jgi:hypothetical protein